MFGVPPGVSTTWAPSPEAFGGGVVTRIKTRGHAHPAPRIAPGRCAWFSFAMTTPTNVFRVDALPSETAPAAPGFGTVWCPLPHLVTLGGCVERLEPGHAICPLHYHVHEEELLYVLEGEVTVRELPPGAGEHTPYREFAVRAGELIVWAAGTGVAHQTRNDGSATARYVVLSDDAKQEIAVYPDSGKVLLRGVGVGVYTPRGAPVRSAAEVTAAAAAVAARRAVVRLDDDARPAHVMGPPRVPERHLGEGRAWGRALAREAGARTVFVNVDRLPPGAMTSPLHAHLGDEELVLVLAGHPTLRQLRGRREGRNPVFDGSEERVALAPGHGVHWAPGDLVAHQLLNESDQDALLLVIGTDRVADDLVIYPERGEVLVAAWMPPPAALPRSPAVTPFEGDAGVGRFEPTDYFAGEVAPSQRA